MQLTTPITTDPRTAHQLRLKAMVKRLVIELGYLEAHIEKGSRDPAMRLAHDYLEDAVEHINEYLETY